VTGGVGSGLVRPPTTVREVFPDAPIDGPLTPAPPPDTLVAARSWTRATWPLLAVGLVAAGAIELMPDHPEFVLPLGAVAALALLAAIATAVAPRSRMSVARGSDNESSWVDWSASRGLRMARLGTIPDGADAPVFLTSGTSREWPAMLEGTVGRHQVAVGATSWRDGDGKNRATHDVGFVLAQLPEQAARMFPGCSLTRFLRDASSAISPELRRGEKLRLESTLFDNTCDVRVAEDASDMRWRELFDPVTIDGLLTTHDIQFVQHGRWLAVVTDPWSVTKVRIAQADALCAGAAWLIDRYLAACAGDVPLEQLRTTLRRIEPSELG
jgi:hypothetical protein